MNAKAHAAYSRNILKRGERPLPFRAWVKAGCPVTQSLGPLPEFHVLVEGGLSDVCRTQRAADRLRSKFEAEGWNVTVLRVVPTIVGPLAVKV
jgi:hypothetical protein